MGYWSTAQGAGGEAGGGWRKLGGSAAGSTTTAIYTAGDTIWRRNWYLETLEERKEKKKEKCHQRRQERHNITAMVDASV